MENEVRRIYNIINKIHELLRKNDNFQTKSLAFGMRTF
ncbi:hypothetical protein FHL81_04005 [Agrobacterium tumefaciens]|nr:hypothetical protein FHL81_04005 [Agrobacterium tumefaciens]KAB0459860.1 hypothetical protein F7R04_13220 [Agrobacterium tumefaciens]KWT77006.1 hypothetical protein ASH09_11705 [Agrobacterium radiobacter]QAA96594.1 hypothetical protein DC439_01635 [Agrobacterium tumefaciens]TGE81818.1 hypothetical protein C9410_01630 [Rhizobium sp. SEMIA 439]